MNGSVPEKADSVSTIDWDVGWPKTAKKRTTCSHMSQRFLLGLRVFFSCCMSAAGGAMAKVDDGGENERNVVVHGFFTSMKLGMGFCILGRAHGF